MRIALLQSASNANESAIERCADARAAGVAAESMRRWKMARASAVLPWESSWFASRVAICAGVGGACCCCGCCDASGGVRSQAAAKSRTVAFMSDFALPPRRQLEEKREARDAGLGFFE